MLKGYLVAEISLLLFVFLGQKYFDVLGIDKKFKVKYTSIQVKNIGGNYYGYDFTLVWQ
ncbi:hypothetical protein bsdcttw_34090 [Anaerocolumna chitinilytica]|uniref:Uncharacterized protein n=1 Tax=Anaerocolumna chitinilytica TaxID=1727145 RepID=A0A7I8DPM9_9FIRM|nr:hypothetical protein bsdcttw_34090 [Anaerocolumna chitinilytica]